ncbi:hypothetical protein [Chlamydia vaughanii]|uniref:hypothetical protein n=1 Tax=Chlamydia vaughanii TaxID=3112552 RepID=UPI0032B16EFC
MSVSNSPQPADMAGVPKFISASQHKRAVQVNRGLLIATTLIGILTIAGGAAATILTGILPLIAIPIVALVATVVLVLTIHKLRPKTSPVPLGFANVDPDFNAEEYYNSGGPLSS